MEPISWINNSEHWRWAAKNSDALLDFYTSAADTDGGGFWWLGLTGQPVPAQGKQLWINARLTYSYAIGHLLGRPGSAALVEHGLDYLRSGGLRDSDRGGWYWAVDSGGNPSDVSKQAYGHAFVLLASSAAILAGFDAYDVFADASAVLDERFWSSSERMFVDTWDAGFTALEEYRGQNANMHLVEALMMAHEVDGKTERLDRAVAIARRLIQEVTANNSGRLPEHFDPSWTFQPDYSKGDRENLFRPYGSTIGHWLEWSRLLLQLDAATGGSETWIPAAAQALFDLAIQEGWDKDRGGFAFSTDWEGNVVNRDRYHWVVTEAIGASVALFRTTGERRYSDWYARFWDFAVAHLIESDGSWRHQLNPLNEPASDAWDGKPDLYHTLQATLFARVPTSQSIALNLAEGKVDDRW